MQSINRAFHRFKYFWNIYKFSFAVNTLLYDRAMGRSSSIQVPWGERWGRRSWDSRWEGVINTEPHTLTAMTQTRECSSMTRFPWFCEISPQILMNTVTIVVLRWSVSEGRKFVVQSVTADRRPVTVECIKNQQKNKKRKSEIIPVYSFCNFFQCFYGYKFCKKCAPGFINLSSLEIGLLRGCMTVKTQMVDEKFHFLVDFRGVIFYENLWK